MYTNISNEFKQAVRSNSIISTARLTFPSLDNLVIGGSLLQDCTITDNCYNDGQLIGTTMSKEAEIKIDNSNGYKLQDEEFKLEVAVQLPDETYEYVPYGSYTVNEYEDEKSNQNYKIVAYDYMNKLNGMFEENKNFNPTFPISAKSFYIQFMSSYGIQCETQTLPNQGFIITSMPGFEGMTARSVLSCLCELFGGFAKINRNNKCQIYLSTETSEKIDASVMNTSLIVNERYGPVNVITIGLSDVEGENVTYQDYDSIQQYGETTIKILDNPILYTEELREQAIPALFDALKGFQYIPTEFKGKSLLYLDGGDLVQALDVKTNEYVNTIILNQTINIPKTRSGEYSNLALSNTETKNKYISKSKQSNTRTEILVDKANKKIETVVSQIGDRSEKTTTITQDIDGISSRVGDIINYKDEREGITQIHLENASKTDIIKLEIQGDKTYLSLLYPSTTLYPSAELYPNMEV